MAADLGSRQLRYFVAVAEELSFTRAATRVFVAQQALSAQIGQLEQRLGLTLFNRTTRRVELTPEGEVFLEEAKLVLQAIERAVDRVQAVHRCEGQTLRLGLLTGGALELTVPILREFQRRFPEAQIRIVEGGFADPTAGLADETADVAFVRPPISTTGLAYAKLFSEPRRLVVGRDHPLAAQKSVRLADALQHPLTAAPCRDQAWDDFWTLDEYRDEQSRPAKGAIVGSVLEELANVATGAGCTVVPAGFARFASNPGVVFVPFADAVAPSVCSLAWRIGDNRPVVQAFVETATDVRDREHAIVATIEEFG